MKQIRVFDYTISIGKGLITKINSLVDFSQYTKAVIVTDSNTPKEYAERLNSILVVDSSIVQIKSGEEGKNIDSVIKIWEHLQKLGCDRKSIVINLGGGVVCDTGGFAAAAYMRGIDFLQIPTTLLSQVDASIGGKTGINFAGIKNLIGTFTQPKAVIIDIDTLKTLPKREFISGFAEIIKHGLILDKSYFEFVTSKKPEDFSQDELIGIIEKSLLIKTEIVTKDEKESGLRKLLNFGHTIGHVVESLSYELKKPLLHGEAISIGMVVEGKISNAQGLLSDKELNVMQESLINAGLPVMIPDIDKERILLKIKSDKKNEKDKINWTLLQGIGKAVYNQQVDQPALRKVI